MLKKNLSLVTVSLLLLLVPAAADAAPTVSRRESAPQTGRGAARARKIELFVVALDDGGKRGKLVGCNDSLVAVAREVSPSRATLRGALEELLRLPEKAGAGRELHNALHASKLRVGRVSVRRGQAVVHLSGSLTLGGACDGPRVRAQIEETALQFPTVKRVRVFVNGKALNDYLSERG